MLNEQTIAAVIENARGSRKILEGGERMDAMLLKLVDSEVDGFFAQVEMPLGPEDIATFICDAQLHTVKMAQNLGLLALLNPQVLAVVQVIILGTIIERIHA